LAGTSPGALFPRIEVSCGGPGFALGTATGRESSELSKSQPHISASDKPINSQPQESFRIGGLKVQVWA
jgi:hypothetical protein